MSRSFRVMPDLGEYVASLAVTQDEAEFIADLIEQHEPRDAAGPEWRRIADALVAANDDEEEW